MAPSEVIYLNRGYFPRRRNLKIAPDAQGKALRGYYQIQIYQTDQTEGVGGGYLSNLTIPFPTLSEYP